MDPKDAIRTCLAHATKMRESTRDGLEWEKWDQECERLAELLGEDRPRDERFGNKG